MAQFSVKTGQIRSLAGDEAGMAQELAGYADSIGRIANSLSFNSWKTANIRARLKSASQNTYSHRAGMSGLSSALTATMDKYDNAERRTVNKLGEQSGQRDLLSKIVSETGKNYSLQNIWQSAYKALTAMAGMGIGGMDLNIVANWRDKISGIIGGKTIGESVGKVGNITDKLPLPKLRENILSVLGTSDGKADKYQDANALAYGWNFMTGYAEKLVKEAVGKVGNITNNLSISKWRDEIIPNVRTMIGSMPVVQAFNAVTNWWDKIFGGNKSQEMVEETQGNVDSKPSEPVGPPSPYPPKYDLPEYVNARPRNVYTKDGEERYGLITWSDGKPWGAVDCWNKPGQISCTYYTIRKLDERGLGYPCIGGPGNGGEWYKNFDKDSGLHHYSGENALTDLKENLTMPQANIVVSFASKYPPKDKRDAGHVLLIDKIYKEGDSIKVKYSDMYRPENIGNLHGTNDPYEETLDEFLAFYRRRYVMNGAAVIGRGNE